MREIKFRAWDTILNKWVAEGFSVIGEVTMFGIIDQYCFENRTEELPSTLERMGAIALSQFTGLKDKNGKEIYEGDILRSPANNEWDQKNYTSYEVFFHDGDANIGHGIGFSMARTRNCGSICGGCIPAFKPGTVSKMEVIGNIYENPELLP